jgi:hypothetical protein
MSPETLAFLKWLIGGATTTFVCLQLFTGQPLHFLGQVFGPDKKELKRLRKENAELRAQIAAVGTDARAALPNGTPADKALLERIENLEALATGDPSAEKF